MLVNVRPCVPLTAQASLTDVTRNVTRNPGNAACRPQARSSRSSPAGVDWCCCSGPRQLSRCKRGCHGCRGFFSSAGADPRCRSPLRSRRPVIGALMAAPALTEEPRWEALPGSLARRPARSGGRHKDGEPEHAGPARPARWWPPAERRRGHRAHVGGRHPGVRLHRSIAPLAQPAHCRCHPHPGRSSRAGRAPAAALCSRTAPVRAFGLPPQPAVGRSPARPWRHSAGRQRPGDGG